MDSNFVFSMSTMQTINPEWAEEKFQPMDLNLGKDLENEIQEIIEVGSKTLYEKNIPKVKDVGIVLKMGLQNSVLEDDEKTVENLVKQMEEFGRDECPVLKDNLEKDDELLSMKGDMQVDTIYLAPDNNEDSVEEDL